jgi:histidinol-phosphate aminotransferase
MIDLDKITRIRNSRGYSSKTLRCDMAERGLNFPDSFYRSVLDSISQLDFLAYPDYSLYENLTKRLGELHGVDSSKVQLGAGSDSLLKALIQTECLCKDKSLLIPVPSFPMVSIYAEGLGVSVEKVEITSATFFDVNTLIDKFNENIGLVIISDPMSPYGQKLKTEQRLQLIKESFR